MTRATFDVHGLRIDVSGAWDEVVEQVDRDLAWFRAEPGAPAALGLTVEQRTPDVAAFDGVVASFVTPRNVVYQHGATTVVDYFGSALLVLDRVRERAVVQSLDAVLAREAVENLLISRIGEHLNRCGLVRLHALGLARTAGAVAIVMPSGGGKSTLALRALRDERCRLLSEDSPLLDARGLLHPFPLRVAFNASDVELVPEGLVPFPVERLEFHPKLALGVDQLRDRFAGEPRPLRHLVLGRRTLSETARLEPLPRRAAAGALLREAVVGVGVYQGMEFMLQRGWADVGRKSGTAGRRAWVASSALRRTRVWQLLLGRDRESNWQALAPLLDDPAVAGQG